MHTHVLLLAGNPGVVEYRPQQRVLFSRLLQDVKARATVHTLGLPSHDLRQLNAGKLAIADHVAFARAYLEADAVFPPFSRSRLVVVGHSYGRYLGMRLIEDMGPDVVRRSGTSGGPRRRLRGACTRCCPRSCGMLWYGCRWHCAGLADVSKAVIDGRRRGLYLNVCSLARDEVRSILEPSDLRAAKTVEERTLLVQVDGYRWCPPAAQEKIREAFGTGLQTEWAGEGVRHAADRQVSACAAIPHEETTRQS